ncbi:hypothetical protein, conserved [Eimeria necatrix]|uniref:Glutathione S-transferase n=1 Tax=Eimeria necatrix TaxID=51315 RepID=U6N4X0_9EIME|nr:hypothetical protein, conserved [Eimeria necatrix]CDJ69760.1 hypothetical protein, conserved [Eimeria necatrix]
MDICSAQQHQLLPSQQQPQNRLSHQRQYHQQDQQERCQQRSQQQQHQQELQEGLHQLPAVQKEAVSFAHRAASLPPSIRQTSSRISVQTIPNHIQQQQPHQLQQQHHPTLQQQYHTNQRLQQPQQSQQLQQQQPPQLQQPTGSGTPVRPSHTGQQQQLHAEQHRQRVVEGQGLDAVGLHYCPSAAGAASRYTDASRGPPSCTNNPLYPSYPLSGAAPSSLPQPWQQQQQQWLQQQWLQQQWQQQQQAMQMQQQMRNVLPAPAYSDPVKLNTTLLRPTQLLPMRLLGDLRLSVHMYLLGKQVKHSVATDEADECTRDVMALIEAREVPADSTMPLLIHDGRVVCGGPEVCLRYLAKKLGQYGIDHMKDALQDRLLMDLNTWFNVQQAAIQSILSPDSMAKDAICDYVKSRRHFYLEAEKLLAFFNSKFAFTAQSSVDASLRAPIVSLDASIRGPVVSRLQPFFLGEEDSLADYFLFSLIDDDQRIAECLISSGSTEETINGDQQKEQLHQENAEVEMHYFKETPQLHALYVALLNLPLIQEALLSSDGQGTASILAAGMAAAQEEGCPGASRETKDRPAPCVATEASTTVSASDSPLQHLQRQQLLMQQQQQMKQLQHMGESGCMNQLWC